MVHLHRVGYMMVKRAARYCPTCECERDFLIRDPDNPYYSLESVCLECGESWIGSEMLERPFRRGWRKRNIEDALDFLRECGEFDRTAESIEKWRERGEF